MRLYFEWGGPVIHTLLEDTETQGESAMWQQRQRLKWCVCKPGRAKGPDRVPEAGRKQEQAPHSPANTLTSDFQPPEPAENPFLWF